MPKPAEHGRLRIVSTRRRAEVSAELFRPAEQQSSLFDAEDPWLIVFACVPDLPEGAFRDLMRYSEPSFVFDLRLAPRFDIGTLNRQRVFEIFDRIHTVYVDTTTPLMGGADREQVIEQMMRKLPQKGSDARRPIVFLHSHGEGSLASPLEILSILKHSERRLHVVSVPESE